MLTARQYEYAETFSASNPGAPYRRRYMVSVRAKEVNKCWSERALRKDSKAAMRCAQTLSLIGLRRGSPMMTLSSEPYRSGRSACLKYAITISRIVMSDEMANEINTYIRNLSVRAISQPTYSREGRSTLTYTNPCHIRVYSAFRDTGFHYRQDRRNKEGVAQRG